VFGILGPAPLTDFTRRSTLSALRLLRIAPHSTPCTETLQYLQNRHRLILVTKGAVAEQSGKIERSGVRKYFPDAEIVAEKDASTYARIIQQFALDRDSTWMIGNSPKSDINPALAAGLHAVFIPHGDTWVLEHEELNPAPSGQKLLIVGRFAELREHF
jgi:putative hydrolase of the HAD superfamily